MNRWSINPPSDEAIYSLGAWIGFGLIAAGLLLGITTTNTPFGGGQPWATLYLALPFVLWGTLILVLRSHVLGLSQGWIAPVALALALVLLAQAYRASDVAMLAGGLRAGLWGLVTVLVNHLPYLALLAIIGAHSRTAGRLGVGAAGIHAVFAVALGLHVAAEESVRSDTWRFIGQVDGTLSRSFVLLLPSLLLMGVDRGRIAATGLAVAFVVSVVGLAHALWFRDQVPVDATWVLVQQLYGVLGSTLLVVVAAAVRIRFEVLCALLVTMIGLSLASTFWITSIGDGDDAQIFSFTIGASLGTAAVIMLWWLLNDREREPDDTPDRPLPLEPVLANPA